MARVLLDALSHQAIRALGTEVEHYSVPDTDAGLWRGVRLAGLETALAAAGHRLVMARPDATALKASDLLIVASRSQRLPFSPAELAAIREFVVAGGGLMLMANHRGMVAPQQQVAKALTLPFAFSDITLDQFPTVEVLTAPGQPRGRLRVRNCSALEIGAGARPLAVVTTDPPRLFAVAASHGRGRIVATGDSGFIASCDDAGLDLWAADDNARFAMSAIAWLVG